MSVLGRRATDPVAAVAASPASPAAVGATFGRRGAGGRPARPLRALVGALLVVTAVVAALAVYTRIGDRVEVVAAGGTVLAGERIEAADLQVVSVADEDGLAVIPASERARLVGQYAAVRLVAGGLIVPDGVQPEPPAAAERVLMSVEIPAGNVPVGLRERSRVVLVVAASGGLGRTRGDVPVPPVLVDATVAAVPGDLVDLAGRADGSTAVSLSVEVDPQHVAVIGAAEEIGVGVLDPVAPADVTFGEQPTAEVTG